MFSCCKKSTQQVICTFEDDPVVVKTESIDDAVPYTDPPVDIDILMEDFGGDMDFIKDLLKKTVVELNKVLYDIEKGVGEGNFQSLLESSHSIKGVAAVMRCGFLHLKSLELENYTIMYLKCPNSVSHDQFNTNVVDLRKQIHLVEEYTGKL